MKSMQKHISDVTLQNLKKLRSVVVTKQKHHLDRQHIPPVI